MEEDEATESADSLLREIARAPTKSPDPERIGRLRVTGRIGAGGMGVVYRAEDESLRRPAAIKVLPTDVQGDDERRKRLVREARAAAALTHPNLGGQARAEYTRALSLRSQRNERDQLFAEALEPVLQRVHEDRPEAAERSFGDDDFKRVWSGVFRFAVTGDGS